MNNATYYQKNRDLILNREKYYFENDKKYSESKQEIDTETYLKKKKNEKWKYRRNRYHNMPEEEKQRLKKYQKTIVRLKSLNLINKIIFLVTI